MRKMSLLPVALLSCIGTGVFASELDFTLVNQTGYDIRAVYIDPDSSSVWTDDIMGADILVDGDAVHINFAAGLDTCIWDLKVDWMEDYDAAVWVQLNLCDISEVTLEYNAETEETIAYTE
jgi:hypothetical protein